MHIEKPRACIQTDRHAHTHTHTHTHTHRYKLNSRQTIIQALSDTYNHQRERKREPPTDISTAYTPENPSSIDLFLFCLKFHFIVTMVFVHRIIHCRLLCIKLHLLRTASCPRHGARHRGRLRHFSRIGLCNAAKLGFRFQCSGLEPV